VSDVACERFRIKAFAEVHWHSVTAGTHAEKSSQLSRVSQAVI
jgi:hypothetical protein